MEIELIPLVTINFILNSVTLNYQKSIKRNVFTDRALMKTYSFQIDRKSSSKKNSLLEKTIAN